MAGKRVALAEDSPDVRELLRRLLERVELKVTAVNDGQALLDLVARSPDEPFDLVLLDMQMPIVDGYEAARTLRARGFSGPIVALTADTQESDRQACLAAGCSDYVRKPVRREELVERVAAAFGFTEAAVTAPPLRADTGEKAAEELHPLVAEMRPVFLEGLAGTMASLVEARRARDEDGMHRLLHNLKGGAAMFGFPELSELAIAASAELEKRTWGEGLDAIVGRLTACADRIRGGHESLGGS